MVILLVLGFLTSCTKQVTIERENFALPEDVEIVNDIEPGVYTENLVMVAEQGPKTFNPLIMEDVPSADAVMYLFSGLVSYDPIDQSFKPGLAKAWTISSDNLTYQFDLRKGVKWSDGKIFTADDVVFTFDLLFDERYPSRLRSDLTIDGKPLNYRKIDDYTVEFSTSKPYAPFINSVGTIYILPKHKLYESYKDGSFQKQWTVETAINTPGEIVGTGPYCIREFLPAERIIYKPNPHYWRADVNAKRLPYIDALVYKYVSDNNSQLALFATGQLTSAALPARDLPWVSKAAEKYDFSIYERGPSASITFTWFNMKPGKNEKGEYYVKPYKLKWFQEKRFRQAILHGINREGIIQATMLGHGVPLHSVVSPANKKWYNPDVRKYDYDPQKAKALLEELKFKINSKGYFEDEEGHSLEIDFLVSEGINNAIVTGIQENLKNLGVLISLTYMDFSTLVDKITNTFSYEYSILGLGSAGSDTGDPAGSKAIYKSNGRLHVWNPEQKTPATEWEAEIDRLFNLQEQEMDIAKRIETVYKIQEIFSEELPLLYLITPDVYVGISNGWKNIKLASMSYPLWNMDELWKDNKKIEEEQK